MINLVLAGSLVLFVGCSDSDGKKADASVGVRIDSGTNTGKDGGTATKDTSLSHHFWKIGLAPTFL